MNALTQKQVEKEQKHLIQTCYEKHLHFTFFM